MGSASFPRRALGDTTVSALGLGCMGMSTSDSKGRPDEATSLATLTAAADMGITHWDTSDMYGPHHNEELIGRWFRENPRRRDEIFLATKFAVKIVGANFQMEIDGSAKYVKEACEASLKRLGVDCIDLYYVHRIDSKTPIEETVGALAELAKEGKIRYVGLSECSARTLRRACKVHPIAAVQIEFSPFALEIEDESIGLKKACRELGVKIVTYSPLGRGWMTGAIKSRADLDPKDARLTMHPRFSEENFPSNLKLVEGIEAMAKEKGCTPSQLALAWVLAQGEDFIPIPGTKRPERLKENAGAVNVEFTPDDEKKLRQVFESVGGAKGSRYPEAFMAACFGDTPELDQK